MRENIIMVGGIRRNSGKVIEYEKIEYGSNIRFRDVAGLKEIDLYAMKHRCVLITMRKEDCLSYFKNRMFIINGNLELNSGSERIDSRTSSGVVLLCLSVEKESKNSIIVENKITWGSLIGEMSRIDKPNIMDSARMSHSESNGFYYGFGNRGVLKIENKSSVGQYVNKNLAVTISKKK